MISSANRKTLDNSATPCHTVCIQMKQTHMTFRVTLEDAIDTGKFTFVTIEDCIDMEDCVNHIHTHFPNMIIDVIAEVH